MTVEFDFNRDLDQPIPDATRLAVGVYIVDNYILRALEFPLGYDIQGAATQTLEQMGFDRVEFLMDPLHHDIGILLLWRGKEQFIIEFAGTDDQVVSLFNYSGERVVEPHGG